MKTCFIFSLCALLGVVCLFAQDGIPPVSENGVLETPLDNSAFLAECMGKAGLTAPPIYNRMSGAFVARRILDCRLGNEGRTDELRAAFVRHFKCLGRP